MLCGGGGVSAANVVRAGCGMRRTTRRHMCATTRRVFDRSVKLRHRERAGDAAVYDYLRTEVGWRVADRVRDVLRRFDVALELGCARGHVSRHLDTSLVGRVLACDMSPRLLAECQSVEGVPLEQRLEDEESLQLPADSLDLAVSSLSLHWMNEPAAVLRRTLTALRPDSPFIGACLGGNTLHELRTALQLAELERRGGLGLHVSPMLRPVDVAALLQQTGYVLITVDVDVITVRYPDALALMLDLQGMAEQNAAEDASVHLGRDTLVAAAAIYTEMYGGDKDQRGVPATFQIINFIGWKYGPNQPKPAARGSAQASLKDLTQTLNNNS